MGTVAFDASVLIGFLDPADAHHSRAVEAIRPWLGAGHTLLISASVYAEILLQPLRAGLADTVDAFIDEIGMRITPVDRSIARHAAVLRAQHTSLRLPDAFVLATAMAHNATLLTFNERIERIIAERGVAGTPPER
ncbi:MAG: hypothetical protein NVSMB22_03530 [Chloroflexota bacterium]